MSVEIALEGARVHYGPLEALHGIDLAVPQRRLTVLLGRNGSGRTTALRALAGTVPLTAGRVRWQGADVTRLPAYARARRGLAFTPDLRAVFTSLTVAENLELVAPGGDISPAFEAYPPLRALRGRRAGTLSGGEQRMVAVSRALLSPARLVLLDEPGQGMSAAMAARTHELLGELDATVVVAEQSLPRGLRAAAGVVYELRRGEVVFGGEPGELD
ncbi:ATP-binding cassette domain-containing protein [Streptomyces sp. A7024]|uniref:ATP-binding cassette domain-containing protein n=1 Tax=Streptomyces coryli TaxID=1128680 RepID=A0A6G4U8Q3_9ACTN|nr:ATP-binding cassette domain-containing protein [Streptomyces coryli]NGN67768.1 ATP-binding cassette domain-containing protein [Streptomyces coryli]